MRVGRNPGTEAHVTVVLQLANDAVVRRPAPALEAGERGFVGLDGQAHAAVQARAARHTHVRHQLALLAAVALAAQAPVQRRRSTKEPPSEPKPALEIRQVLVDAKATVQAL